MDWEQRGQRNTFYKSYFEFLLEAKNKISAEKQQQLKEPLQLSSFQKAAISVILKEAITKISVINRAFDAKNKLIELPASKRPMEVRFKENFIEKLYDDQTLQPLRECYKRMSENKLKNDVELIRRALELCLSELEESDRFNHFAEFIFAENREAYDEFNLLATYSENQKKLEELKDQLKQTRTSNESTLAKLHNDLFSLKTECEGRREIHKLGTKMIEKWESARQEQVEAIFNHELKKLNQERDEFEEKTERELIAINEIIAFYRVQCTNLENSIEQWQRRFATERDDLDEQIKHTSENIEDVRSKHQMLREWYEKREKFIEEYYIERRELEELRKMEQMKCAAAIRIQAFWRGTMVRKGLGPYRQKKKNKKPKPVKKK